MTQAPEPPLRAHRVIAKRVKELRKGRGWSAQRLSGELKAVGIAWDRSIVANFESGRRPYVTVEELLALAYVLSVAPVHMIVPPLSSEELTPTNRGDPPYSYAITPTVRFAPTAAVRDWIRGLRTVGEVDPRLFFSQVPPEEFSVKASPEDPVERMATQRMAEEAARLEEEAARDEHPAAPDLLRLAEHSIPIPDEEKEGEDG